VPDLIRREFTAPMPGLKLIGDISCFATGEGWVYLATVLDLCGKELIGYAIAPRMRANLAVEAITVAHRARLVDCAAWGSGRFTPRWETAHRGPRRRVGARHRPLQGLRAGR
jgi:transposase InsO family protein